MIESIQINGVATYSDTPENMSGLSKFNFFYGSNGSGKTTITRVIADEEAFPVCKVTWTGGTKLQTMVYNRDFVTKNFSPSAELKGIFTLGEKNVDTLNKIAAAKGELDTFTKTIETLNVAFQGEDGTGGKKGELAVRESEAGNDLIAVQRKLLGLEKVARCLVDRLAVDNPEAIVWLAAEKQIGGNAHRRDQA